MKTNDSVEKNGAEKTDWHRRAEDITFETQPFIEGRYVSASGTTVFYTENPANKVRLAEFSNCGAGDVDRAVVSARAAFRDGWRTLAPERRKETLLMLACAVRENREHLALLDCLEMGMPIANALDQVDAAIDFIQYYAELADKIYGDIAPSDSANTLAMTCHEPRGVVGVISPWNFPLLTAVLAIAPALAAGNTVVAKPSELAPSSVLRLAEVAVQSGLPAGVFNVVPGKGGDAGAALARHMDVDKIHFTGSTVTGRQVMAYSGQSNGKPVMLETGGKSPQIVFEDAVDIEGLGAALAQSAFINTGQLCVARTRLIVHESVENQVVEALHKATHQIFTVGNTLDQNVNYGPIASRNQYERVTGYLDVASTEGADLQIIKTAGEIPKDGFYLPPYLLANARNHMRASQEEIFGPVLAVINFKTEQEAIALANDVSYGLAATVWTQNLGCARRLARDIDAGRVDIRTSGVAGASLAALSAEPFGGSGHGVLGGPGGLDPYLRSKAVQIITD